MLYSLNGFAKDPAVVNFGGRYLMYHSAYIQGEKPLRIAIAESSDLDNWNHIGYIPIDTEYEKNGNGAPSAIVLDGKVHMFYQTYGNWANDAICHAVSEDGITFIKDETNPVFRPSKDWCCGRAIDADITVFNGRLYLYFATRDKDMKIQKLGAASAEIGSAFGREDFRQEVNHTVLEPELDWEQECIEAPATFTAGGRVWMFYGGAYNCHPQQIGLAVSDDGVNFRRTSDKPFFAPGNPGDWNASESGHPYAFEDNDGTYHLFFQGSPDSGKTWILSRMTLNFTGSGFEILKVYDGRE